MRCIDCGYTWKKREIINLEPVTNEADRTHGNYVPEEDAIAICPVCLQESIRESEAYYKRYMYGVEYACGIRD